MTEALPVAVIGAGPAGLRAAQVLAEAGLRPVLIDENPAIGGQIYRKPPPALRALRPARALYGGDWRRAQALDAMMAALAGRIDTRLETLVWNAEARDFGARLTLRGTDGADRVLDVAALVLATGAMDRILPVPGWTAPGVWSLGGAQVMLKAQAQLVGRRPVFAGSGPLLYLVAWQYAQAGARPAAVIDSAGFGAKLAALPGMLTRPAMVLKGARMAFDLRRMGVPVIEGAHAERIDPAADGLVLRWQGPGGRSGQVTGDAVALGHGLNPERQLADLLGCRARFDDGAGQWLAEVDGHGRASVPGVYLAGDIRAIEGAHAAEYAGEVAARALLRDMGRDDPAPAPRVPALRGALALHRAFRRALERAFPFPQARIATLPDETIVCRCEGVTAADLRRAIADWQPADINRLKAMTRCGMGRCQSRLCGHVAAGLLAAETGKHRAEVGAIRGQAPVKPLPAPFGDGGRE